MPSTNSFCVLLHVETDDPRLTAEKINQSTETVEGINAVRAALLERLPADVARVILVTDVEQARLLVTLHEAVGAEIGAPPFQYPPAGYKPPTH